LVTETSDRVVGFGGSRGTFITWLFAHPEYRRKGVAPALVREILARLDGTITQQWLPKLAPLLPLAIPVPLAKGTPGEGYPWHWSVCR
jgi:GNAT superfamily N-acetyltransferase